MGRHALAYVKWDVLRRGPGGHAAFRANFYRSDDPHIHELDDGAHSLTYNVTGGTMPTDEQMTLDEVSSISVR